MIRKNANKKPILSDGMISRGARRTVGDFQNIKPLEIEKPKAAMPERSLKADYEEVITEQDIIESTRSDVDNNKISAKKGRIRRWLSRRKIKRIARNQKWAKRPKWLRIIRRTFMVGKYAVVFGVLYFAITSWSAINNIIDRGGDGAIALQDNIQPSELKGEGDGRINVMLLGIGGEKHTAGNLADSIIIASIDPFAHEMAMLSIPRDMYVEIPGYYSSKINAAHALGEDDPNTNGIALMRETVESVLGINIHYYVRVDFDGFIDAVNTVGGVDVTLEEAVYDNNFDWQYGRDALRLPAGKNHLDGTKALLLSRARGAGSMSYGLAGSDFSRAENQRKVLLALKDKILAAGTFANPVRLTELIKNAGSHVRTDIQINEMVRFEEIIGEIPAKSIISFGLSNAGDNYLTSGNIGGASVLLPRSGDYSEIQLFIRELFIDGFIKQEQPLIDVYNGSGIAGLGLSNSELLATYGYNIGTVDNAPTQDYEKTVIYDLSNDEKPYTRQLISNRYKVTMQPAEKLPKALATTEADFVIIIGKDNAEQDTSF